MINKWCKTGKHYTDIKNFNSTTKYELAVCKFCVKKRYDKKKEKPKIKISINRKLSFD